MDFKHFFENKVTRSGVGLDSQNRQLKFNDSNNYHLVQYTFKGFCLKVAIVGLSTSVGTNGFKKLAMASASKYTYPSCLPKSWAVVDFPAPVGPYQLTLKDIYECLNTSQGAGRGFALLNF